MPNHTTSRRAILTGAVGVAAAGALPAMAPAEPIGITPSADFHEVCRIAGFAKEKWQERPATEEAEEKLRAEVARLEEPLDAIEARLMSQPPTPSDLLAWAGLVLYHSDAGSAGFDDPVGALTRLAKEGDCFESRAALLAAAVFKAADVT